MPVLWRGRYVIPLNSQVKHIKHRKNTITNGRSFTAMFSQVLIRMWMNSKGRYWLMFSIKRWFTLERSGGGVGVHVKLVQSVWFMQDVKSFTQQNVRRVAIGSTSCITQDENQDLPIDESLILGSEIYIYQSLTINSLPCLLALVSVFKNLSLSQAIYPKLRSQYVHSGSAQARRWSGMAAWVVADEREVKSCLQGLQLIGLAMGADKDHGTRQILGLHKWHISAPDSSLCRSPAPPARASVRQRVRWWSCSYSRPWPLGCEPRRPQQPPLAVYPYLSIT